MSDTNPRNDGAGQPAEGSRANWFELFFDLVFVVTLYQLAHELHGDPHPADFAAFLALFFPAWWAWINLTVTVNVFGPANWRTQAMLVAAMPGLGLMAAAIPDGLGERAWAYALGAAWVRLVYLPLWWRAARSASNTFPLLQPLLYGLLPALLWAISAAVPGPARFVLWAIAVGLELLLLAVRAGVVRTVFTALAAEHLAERIGLFVIIVFGESVLTIVLALAGHFTPASGIAALAGFATITALATIFYLWGAPGTARGLRRAHHTAATRRIRDAIMYLPFVQVAGITVLAAALDTTVTEPLHTLPPGARAALCGGLLAYTTAAAVLDLRYGTRPRTTLRWYLPSLATTALLIPATTVLPAWSAVTVAAALLILLITLGRLRILTRA
ncbi:low temperature requirement protein A [Nonomuraea sp. NPDC050394]|uniref:low temperature requirement protein A n=1 Tax=Nonomuraea sp. NPDC050394 TaxID=3364363 RepID=UPI0037901EBA